MILLYVSREWHVLIIQTIYSLWRFDIGSECEIVLS